MQGIVAIPGPHSAFTMVTPSALCLHLSMRLGSMGTRERMYVWERETGRGKDQCERGPKFVVAFSYHKGTHTHTHTHTVKILITFSQLSPLEQS